MLCLNVLDICKNPELLKIWGLQFLEITMSLASRWNDVKKYQLKILITALRRKMLVFTPKSHSDIINILKKCYNARTIQEQLPHGMNNQLALTSTPRVYNI